MFLHLWTCPIRVGELLQPLDSPLRLRTVKSFRASHNAIVYMLLVASFLHVASAHPMKPESEVAVRVSRNLLGKCTTALRLTYTVLRKQRWSMQKTQSCQVYLTCHTSLGQWRHVVCGDGGIAVAVVHRSLELEI